MEYLFQVTDADGTTRFVTDPANPRRVPGAFGEKSVLEFRGTSRRPG
jgi:enterochelin esterase family protein